MFGALRAASRPGFPALRAARTAPVTSNSRFLARTIVTKKFTSDHEAVIFDSDSKLGTVTITNYAQSSLGDVVFVELPVVGTEVEQGDQIGAVESVKAASDIYAPISGVVEAVNEQLNSQPGLLNKSPEGDGWLCKIKVADEAELEKLMTEDAYKKHCEES
ncbi:glycine cleavage system protein H [Phanerochaete sordida]|uniref:Glycine cleavage system H protein n=1 Tax=Phanerochaete sordida TaxID=48140 RepID=A0A9P3G4U2_9APHY|nr:glycine cleavage system protein H [Phanerochaete sordida]